MADPVIVACTKDIWTKVATNVTTGYVWIKDSGPNVYFQTYRDTGGAAPSDNADAVNMSLPGMPIAATAGIDVYIQPVKVDGSVRVDI